MARPALPHSESPPPAGDDSYPRAEAGDEIAPALSAAPSGDAPAVRVGKRRRFLVDPRTQLRAGLLATTVVLVLLVLLNLSLHAVRASRTSALIVDSPELTLMLRSQDRIELLLVLLASSVFLAGVFVVTVLETHRTAGAVLNLDRRLHDVQQGRYSTRLRLRRGDHLRQVESSFNAMARSLQERSFKDVDALERLAAQAEGVASPIEATQLAASLRNLADEHRRLAD